MRRRRYHLIAKAADTSTICGLPKYRRSFLVLSGSIDAQAWNTCDACECVLALSKQPRRGRR